MLCKTKLLKIIKQQKILILLGQTAFQQIKFLNEFLTRLQEYELVLILLVFVKNPINITQNLIWIDKPNNL
jgi:hypothetical protein